jgi:hypothetical protein
MAQGQRPAYDVFTSREVEGQSSFYTRVGAAWKVSKGGISIVLDALPVDGRLVMFPAKEKD